MNTTIETEHESQDVAGSLRELLQVALPLIVSAGSLSLMTTVDRAFLAALSVDALAASMPAALMLWTALSLPMGIASYTNAFASQYEGAGRKERVAAAIWQGLFVAMLGTLFIVPFAVYAPDLFRTMQHDVNVQKLEVEYFRYLTPSAFPLLISAVLSAFFAARKETRIVMYVNVATSILNCVLDYFMIFGGLGIPAMGIQGAAIATVIAQFVGAIVFGVILIRKAKREAYPFRQTLQFDSPLLKRMLYFGFPNGVQMFLDVGAFTAFLVLVGQLGTREQAATNLAFTLNSLAFIPMTGMGTAVMTLVGRRIGEQRPELAERTVWKAMAVSALYMIGFAAIYLTLPQLILSPFMNSGERELFEEIQPMVIQLLRFVAVYTLFDALAIVFGSAIRGAGETRFSMIFTITMSWCLMVIPTWWIIRTSQSLYACWVAATVFVITIGIGFMIRFMQGKWKSVQVIEQQAVPSEFPLPNPDLP